MPLAEERDIVAKVNSIKGQFNFFLKKLLLGKSVNIHTKVVHLNNRKPIRK